MQRAIRLNNGQAVSSLSHTTQTPLLQRIAPREELLSVPGSATARRAAATIPRPKQTKQTHESMTLPVYSYLTLFPSRQVIYFRNLSQPRKALLSMAYSPVIGFDIEWKPNFVKGRPENRVACIQLADQNSVAVLQVSSIKSIPEEAVAILQDASVTKVGVGISDDIKKMRKDWGVEAKTFVDLSGIARAIDPSWEEEERKKAEARKLLLEEQAKIGMLQASPNRVAAVEEGVTAATAQKSGESPGSPKGGLISLARLTERYLSLTLVKNKNVSRSNWEKVPLTKTQLDYAANDAAVAFDIYQILQHMQGEISLPAAAFDIYQMLQHMQGEISLPAASPFISPKHC